MVCNPSELSAGQVCYQLGGSIAASDDQNGLEHGREVFFVNSSGDRLATVLDSYTLNAISTEEVDDAMSFLPSNTFILDAGACYNKMVVTNLTSSSSRRWGLFKSTLDIADFCRTEASFSGSELIFLRTLGEKYHAYLSLARFKATNDIALFTNVEAIAIFDGRNELPFEYEEAFRANLIDALLEGCGSTAIIENPYVRWSLVSHAINIAAKYNLLDDKKDVLRAELLAALESVIEFSILRANESEFVLNIEFLSQMDAQLRGFAFYGLTGKKEHEKISDALKRIAEIREQSDLMSILSRHPIFLGNSQ